MEKERIERYLKNSIARGRLNSAYLFFAGILQDKEKTALNFAKAIECEKEDFPCNTCENCLKIESFTHPDVKWLKGEGAVSSLAVEEIREIGKEMYFKPYRGKKKIYIFEIERLNEESSNAFLKTLEEPPEHTILLLIAKSDKEFLPTIVSRCQKIMFSSKKVFTEEEKELQKKLIKTVDSLSLESPAHLFDIAEEISKSDSLPLSFDLLLYFYRDLLLLKNRAKDFLINSDLSNHSKLNSSQIIRIIKNIANTKGDLHRSANLKLSIELMLMNILDITRPQLQPQRLKVSKSTKKDIKIWTQMFAD